MLNLRRRPDWAAIKTNYLAGEGSFRELAKRFNVSFHTLSKRAKREGWTSQVAKLCDAVTTAATETATERGKELGFSAVEFVQRSIRETEGWLNRLESLANENKLTPHTAHQLVTSWRSVLGAGREAFNLDSRDRAIFCFGAMAQSGRPEILLPAAVVDVPECPAQSQITDEHPA